MRIITMPPPSFSSTTVVEITTISIEGLDNYTSFFNPTIKPFITITKLPSTTTQMTTTLTWDHKFRVTVDHSFFQDRYSCLYLQLFTKRRIVGPTQLGWCMIPASDIGLLPQGSVRYLSYRIRAKDGSRGHAVINLSVRWRDMYMLIMFLGCQRRNHLTLTRVTLLLGYQRRPFVELIIVITSAEIEICKHDNDHITRTKWYQWWRHDGVLLHGKRMAIAVWTLFFLLFLM